MLIIGLTGIIGAGKSTVAQILHKEYGAWIIDADQVGHQLLKTEPTKSQVLKTFGTNQRPELGKIVFENKQQLRKLNKLMWPAIYNEILQLLKKSKKELVVIEAALLFPIGLNKLCSQLIFVDAPEEIRRKRLTSKGLSLTQINQRLKANRAVLQLKKKCSVVIQNNSTISNLKNTCRAALFDMLLDYCHTYNKPRL